MTGMSSQRVSTVRPHTYGVIKPILKLSHGTMFMVDLGLLGRLIITDKYPSYIFFKSVVTIPVDLFPLKTMC